MNCDTSNRANPAKTLLLNGSTEPTGLKSWMLILFEDLDQVRQITDQWSTVYNEQRPHRALGKLPPRAYRQQAENSTSLLST
ncbi:MAG: transposase [Burkholderiaceae bacterium]|nr:transposase [Burkholderiaceae bacterium]